MGRLSTLQMCNIATRPFSKDMKCWLENQLVGSGFFKIAGHPNNHPLKDGIVSLDQKEEDRIGFFSVHPAPPMFWSQVTKPSPNLKEGTIETWNWKNKIKSRCQYLLSKGLYKDGFWRTHNGWISYWMMLMQWKFNQS